MAQSSPVEQVAAGGQRSSMDSPLSDDELSSIELFDAVDIETIKPLLHSCAVRRLQPGEVLIEAGRPNEYLYIVLSGKLSVRLAAADADPLTEINARESVGEMSMIDQLPTSAFVVAETPCRVLAIDEQLIWLLVNTSHAISTNLLFTLTKRLRFGNKIIFENKERIEQFRFHATVDALTGLFNRHWLNSMVPRQMQRSRLRNEALSLLMADIDHFKAYNDQHGHVAGDRAISAVATTIRDTLRPADMAVRFGGEEFLVVLVNCTGDVAARVAERLRFAVANAEINFAHGAALPPVTVSVGVAEYANHESLEGFIADTDAALYRAKRAGRNCVAI